jgi:hypothetical protein
MSTKPLNSTVRLKMTISREEHPAMFDALVSIRNPRHRTGRIKELVVKALTLEQIGAAAMLGLPQVDGGLAPRGSGSEAVKADPPAATVTSMLDWDTSQT